MYRYGIDFKKEKEIEEIVSDFIKRNGKENLQENNEDIIILEDEEDKVQ